MTDEEIDAMEAGLQMDRLISLAVFGLEVQECLVGSHPPGCPGNTQLPRYSTYLPDAWLVVERMRQRGACFQLCDQAFTKLRLASFTHSIVNITLSSYAQADALAICRAALKCCKPVADKKEDAVKTSVNSRFH